MPDQESQIKTGPTALWIDRYVINRLTFKRETTQSTYALILRQFLVWLSDQPGHEASFNPSTDLTQTAVQTYLFKELAGTSVSHRERVKSILSSFAEWLIDEELLTRNPTRSIELPAPQLLSPRELSTDQRYILKELIETEDLRGQAMFALGYYAGCRASDVCWFRLDQIHHLTKKSGQITIGYKRGQFRTLDLVNEARKPLHAYLEEERKQIQTHVPLSFSPNGNIRFGSMREITPDASLKEDSTLGGALSRRKQRDSSGSTLPISPSMTCDTTSAIGYVPPALL
jgi:site-specific recombinase XerD